MLYKYAASSSGYFTAAQEAAAAALAASPSNPPSSTGSHNEAPTSSPPTSVIESKHDILAPLRPLTAAEEKSWLLDLKFKDLMQRLQRQEQLKNQAKPTTESWQPDDWREKVCRRVCAWLEGVAEPAVEGSRRVVAPMSSRASRIPVRRR